MFIREGMAFRQERESLWAFDYSVSRMTPFPGIQGLSPGTGIKGECNMILPFPTCHKGYADM